MTNNEIRELLEERLDRRVDINNIRYNEDRHLYEVDYSIGWYDHNPATVTDEGEVQIEDNNVEVWHYKVGPAKIRQETFNRDSGDWKSKETLFIGKKQKAIIDTAIRSDEELSEIPGVASHVDSEMAPYIVSITCKGTSIRGPVEKNRSMLDTDWDVIVRPGSFDKKVLNSYLENYILGQCSDGVGEGFEQKPIITKDSTPKLFGSYQYGKETTTTYFSMWMRETQCKRV